jgi:hypothetical protein
MGWASVREWHPNPAAGVTHPLAVASMDPTAAPRNPLSGAAVSCGRTPPGAVRAAENELGRLTGIVANVVGAPALVVRDPRPAAHRAGEEE